MRGSRLEVIANLGADFDSNDLEANTCHHGRKSQTDKTQSKNANSPIAEVRRNVILHQPTFRLLVMQIPQTVRATLSSVGRSMQREPRTHTWIAYLGETVLIAVGIDDLCPRSSA